jgi:4-hydroxy-tetrahydrodipicolinate synthase
MSQTLQGIIVPTTIPFDRAGEIDEPAFRGQIRFMIDGGVHGLAIGGSTGEGHTLDDQELRRLNEVALDEARGRVPVIAGIIVDSTRQAIRREDLPLAALQVTPVHYLFKPDADATFEHFRALCAETAKPVIIYNVVPWNYLSQPLLHRIMREVPGVLGVKQSAGDLKLLADLMLDLPPGKLVFSAVDALLYPSFMLGAHGTISAIPTAVPHACVALWDAVRAGRTADAHAFHLKLLRVWNALLSDNLPAAVKFAQSLQGCPAGWPRAPMPWPSEAQQRQIRDALGLLGEKLPSAA